MKLQESGEMYLETILVLSQTKSTVHSVDVGESMGFSKPSVSRAVGILKKEGYVTVAEDGCLFLTETGEKIAKTIYERHRLLTDFLMKIGVEEKTAASDACKMEHDISNETFEALKAHAKKYNR